MSRTYRVIQWATGTVGKVALRHFIENPVFELVGVYVTNPDKVGKDAGTLLDMPEVGIKATNDVNQVVALAADCVLFAPLLPDVETICRLLRSGKNVVSPLGPVYRTPAFAGDVERIEAACAEGGTSFHGCGIHPGFVGDILPLTLTRLSGSIERIEVSEIADKQKTPSVYIEFMGFGQSPAELLSKPNCMTGAMHAFAQSMALLVEGLGKTIGDVTEKHELAIANNDIPYEGGVIRAGTVAGQHWEWTAWTGGKPLVVFHLYYRVGDDMQPAWHLGESRHHIEVRGDPSFEMTLRATAEPDGHHPFLGIIWTALLGCTAVPQVCDAAPGLVTHLDLGVVRPRGLVQS